MKAGFVLIEVLIASVVSSLLGVALFTAFYQVNKAVRTVDDFVDVYAKVAVFHHQLEKDIAGIMVPAQAEKNDKKEPSSSHKPISHLFYGSNRGDMFNTLTFITNNPLQVFWGDQAGKPKPRIARIVYRLVEDKHEKGSYSLMRQEDYQLDYDLFKGDTIRKYELVDGIKDLTFNYIVALEEEKNKDKKKVPSSDGQPKNYKTLQEWDLEEVDEKTLNHRTIPHYLEVAASFWDTRKERQTTLILTLPIVSDFTPMDSLTNQVNDTKQDSKKSPEVKKQPEPQQKVAATQADEKNSMQMIVEIQEKKILFDGNKIVQKKQS